MPSQSRLALFASTIGLLTCVALATAAPRDGKSTGVKPAAHGVKPAAHGARAAAQVVDVFDAMKDGRIAVKYIAENEHKAHIVVENKTKQPLTVKLPEAFAGVPVLAQAADAGAQAQGGAAGGAAAFNVAPERTRRITVPALCLEHGKPDPTSKMAYELKPIESISDKPEVPELLARYGRGEVNVRVAQAAAWHLQNNLSWKELAAKELRHARRPNEPYFSRAELMKAMHVTKDIAKKVNPQPSGASALDSYAPPPAK